MYGFNYYNVLATRVGIFLTVAEKDTAAAVQAALGPPESRR